MKNLYWIGIRESDISFCSNLFENSITIFGKHNISMQNKMNRIVDYNDENNFILIDQFFTTEMKKIIKENRNARFMYYNQLYAYHTLQKEGLLKYAIFFNNQNLVKKLSNKIKCKEELKKIVPVLEYKIIQGKCCTYSYFQKEFQDYNSKYVIQSESSQGGSGTFIINSKEDQIQLNPKESYMITKYCSNNIPINIHVLITSQKIYLLPGSVQIIQEENHRLAYKGYDFIAYQSIPPNLIKKIEGYATTIAEKLQKDGYRGLCGIDSIIYNNEIYFMEINARFQNSSIGLNKALQENQLPSLQNLVINCFLNQEIKLKKFRVNYSGLMRNNNDLTIQPIEILDDSGKEQNYSINKIYLYNQSIVDKIK